VIRVVLADDHETVRQGLKLLVESQPDMEVVGEAGDGRQAVQLAQTLQPTVVVLDISMPELNGLNATRAMAQSSPGTAVVALTRYSDDAYVQALLGAGASAYVLKQSTPAELLKAIRAAAEGKRYLDASLAARVAGAFMARHALVETPPRITEREAEVLRLIAAGHSNKEIAARLDISVKTVEVHKANAMRKLSLRGRIDIVRYALLQGWLHDH
jgi:DNA-binding NarL/FixJ family response regulator